MARIAFAGTPEFARYFLETLLDDGHHEVVAVYTQPDRPKGRGRKLQPSPVKVQAVATNIPVFTPTRWDDEACRVLTTLNLDYLVVVAYGALLPARVLAIPRFGCLNIHPSRLPRWRGAAPMERAIQAGDKDTGVAIMQMVAALDAGPVLAEAMVAIGDKNSAELTAAIQPIAARLLLAVLANPEQYPAKAQATTGVTYAHKIKANERVINAHMPADALIRTVRALGPCWLMGVFASDVRVFAVNPVKACDTTMNIAQGDYRVVDNRLFMGVADGTVELLEVQAAGKRRMAASEFIHGLPRSA